MVSRRRIGGISKGPVSTPIQQKSTVSHAEEVDDSNPFALVISDGEESCKGEEEEERYWVLDIVLSLHLPL